MNKQLTFNSFQILPLKVRKSLVCEVLISRWHYNISGEGKERERAFSKALIHFQKSIGAAGNGIVCEKTFEALGPIEACSKSR